MDEDSAIVRPRPRRPFQTRIIPVSSSPTSSIPALSSTDTESPVDTPDTSNGDDPDRPYYSRSMSTRNLTASTLFGIYEPTTSDPNRDEPTTPWGTGAQTPWGTGAQTPARSQAVDAMRRDLASVFRPYGEGAVESQQFEDKAIKSGQAHRPQTIRRRSSVQALRSIVLPTTTRLFALFAFGVAYGLVVSKLHENRNVTPVQVEGIKRGFGYLTFWGMAGVGLGSLLPWVDWMWARNREAFAAGETEKRRSRAQDSTANKESTEQERRRSQASPAWPESRIPGTLDTDWSLVVRSVGAFIGIAFAIRKTPWQSTLQLSLTLALVNPVLWYLLDRSKPGFVISTIVGLTGTAILLGVNPNIVPSPAPHTTNSSSFSSLSQISNHTAYAARKSAANDSALGTDAILMGLASAESIGVATWIASVLFCSSICFGNIGRKLALKGPISGTL